MAMAPVLQKNDSCVASYHRDGADFKALGNNPRARRQVKTRRAGQRLPAPASQRKGLEPAFEPQAQRTCHSLYDKASSEHQVDSLILDFEKP
jgi:hypothetical protein